MPEYGAASHYYGDIESFVLWDGAHIVRAPDLQTTPVWELIDSGISGTIFDVQYFFVDDDTVGAWCLTGDGVYLCLDIRDAATPSWAEALTITEVRAVAVAPAAGTVDFASMTHAWGLPGHLCVAMTLSQEDDGYLHSYYWVTDDYGANWTPVDHTADTFGTSPTERCYYSAGRYSLASLKDAPYTIWCGRGNGRTGTNSGDGAVFKSEDLGYTWTKGYTFVGGRVPANGEVSLLAPFPTATDPSYLTVAIGGTTPVGRIYVSADGWATATQLTEPSGHDGAYGVANQLQRPSKDPFVEQHILAIFRIDASSNGDLYESVDGGANWTLLDNLNNSTVTPAGWPADPLQWVLVDNTDDPHIQLTLDNFDNLSDKTGNLASVLTWTVGAVAGGFALPKAALAPAVLDASLTKFLRVQAGKQSAFDDPATPTFALPVAFDYQQGDIEQIAAWDSGVWTPTEIVEKTSDYATFKLSGAMFFELLPIFFNAGFGEMTPSGDGPYGYSGSAGQSAVGSPSAYTFRFGGGDVEGDNPGTMVQVQDAYLQQLTLTFSLANLVVLFESKWFGRLVDDNEGEGYAPEAVSLPDGLTMVNGLLSIIGVQDATDTGGAFDDLTEFECSVIEWALAIDTGLRPLWAADQNQLTYCGVRYEEPSASWQPHIRTTAANYALTLTKAQLRQYQELLLRFDGVDRQFDLAMTGRWLGKLNGHDRSREEVAMKPTFQVRTPATQTTTPHWLSWEIEAGWEHE